MSYYNWLHKQWPTGDVDKFLLVGEDGASNRCEVRIVGDLSKVLPLLKLSSATPLVKLNENTKK